MSWQAHVEVLRDAEVARQAARADNRYVVMEVYCDGNPADVQAFDNLVDALDLRDELRRERPSRRSGPVFFVVDRDDEERGWLDHDDACEVVW